MRVVITRPQKDVAELASALRDLGAEPVFLPTIQIDSVADTTAIDNALSNLKEYDWLVLTSANAVDVVFRRMLSLGLDALPTGLRVAAVGSKTAARMKSIGVEPDFVPQEFIAEALAPGLGDLRGRWVLLPTADIAHDTLPKAIQAADGIAHVITAYRTIPSNPDPEGLSALSSGVDMITFTSGSTARNFVTLVREAGLDPFNLPGRPRIACIGPKTAQAARQAGFQVDIVASEYSVSGLVQAIHSQIDDHRKNKNGRTAK